MTRPADKHLPPLPPLTSGEQRKLFAALDRLARRRAELLAARGGRLYPNSWEEFPNVLDDHEEHTTGP